MNKIKDVKTTIYKWTGKIVPPSQNFCTNPTDLLREKGDKMKLFKIQEQQNAWYRKAKSLKTLINFFYCTLFV